MIQQQFMEYDGHKCLNACGCSGRQFMCGKCYEKFNTVDEFNAHILRLQSKPMSCGCRRN